MIKNFRVTVMSFFPFTCSFIAINSERQQLDVEYRFGEGSVFT